MNNYQYVLSRAVNENPQVWFGEFPDAANAGWTMISDAPPSADLPEWAKIIRDLEHEVAEVRKL